MPNILETLDRFPPFACRIVARKSRSRWQRLMTHDDIAAKCGLSKRTVLKLSRKVTWANVSVDTMMRFSSACGVNLLKIGSQVKYLRGSFKTCLQTASPKQRLMLKKLMALKPAR